MSILEIRNLKKYYPTSAGVVHAVDDVSFTLDEGQTLGVVGESGCGKSTLGNTIIRLTEPTDGQIFFEGKEIVHLTKKEFKQLRMRMQMIFQDPFASLDPRMSVSALIAEPLKIFRMYDSKKQENEKVDELMETVGLAKRLANTYPHELDGGRRQRIGIARALALDPRFIVCDEPVSALDVSIQAQILNLLMELQKKNNLTYMFITHDLSVVKHISDEIAVMYLGEIVEKCSSKELFRETLHPYTQALLSAIPVPNLNKKRERIILKGELSSPIDPPASCRFASRCMYATDKCLQYRQDLKEVKPGHFVACARVQDGEI